MNTHSLTTNKGLLKVLEFLPTHFSGTDLPLQDDSLNQETSFSTQRTQVLCHLQKTYSPERRCFL